MRGRLADHLEPGAPLPQLLAALDCPDVIAPVDEVPFGRRAGELIARSRRAAPTQRDFYPRSDPASRR
jgi:hypothetical protein